MYLILAVLWRFGSVAAYALPDDERWDSPFCVPGVQNADGSVGFIYDVAIIGEDVYVGGNFKMAGGKPVSTQGSGWGNIARWNQSQQKWFPVGEGVSDTVSVFCVVGTDLYVGGNFAHAGNSDGPVTVNNIARYNTLDQTWYPLGVGVNSFVCAIVAWESSVFVGGLFNAAGGATARHLAQWVPSTEHWYEVGFGVGEINYSDVVNDLVISPDGQYLYAGGSFATVGGGLTGYGSIARYSLTSFGWNSLGGGVPNGAILALGVDATGALYAGGQFSSIGGQSAQSLARYSGTSWAAITPSLNPAFGSVIVDDLCVAPDNNLMVAGSFSEGDGVTRLDGGEWHPLWDNNRQGIENGGRALAVRDLGGSNYEVYVGGRFTNAAGRLANGIARWSTTSAWFPLGPALNDEVLAVLDKDGKVYLGGKFTEAGTRPVGHVTAWDPSTQSWSALGGGVGGGTHPHVRVLAVDADSNLYMGGAFSTLPNNMGGQTDAGSIAQRTSSGTWNNLGGGTDGAVYAILVDGDLVYVAGDFANAGGVPANRIAVWNRTTGVWSALGTGISDGAVYALALHGNDLYVGGTFLSAGGTSVHNLARWDCSGHQWYDVGGGVVVRETDSNAVILALEVVGDTLYFGGNFDYLPGPEVTAYQLASYEIVGNVWSSLGGGFGYGPGVVSMINSIKYRAPYLSVAGFFSQMAPGVAVRGIARYHVNTRVWSVPGPAPQSGDPQVDGRSLCLSQGSLLLGGYFTQIGGVAAQHLARFQEGVWTSLGSGPDGPVTVVKKLDGMIYAGGEFQSAGGLRVNRVAAWNPSTELWSPLGTGLQNGVDGPVYDFMSWKNQIYTGGQLLRAGTLMVQGAARYDPAGNSWSALEGGGVAECGNVTYSPPVVYAFQPDFDHYYVAGSFVRAGGVTCNNIAQYTTATGWSDLDGGTNNAVRSLNQMNTGVLYAGGMFNTVGNPYVMANGIAAWSGSEWMEPAGGAGAPFPTVMALCEIMRDLEGSMTADLYVGGILTFTGGATAPILYRIVNNVKDPLSSGMDAQVNSLDGRYNMLYAGGSFTKAGGNAASRVARWSVQDQTWSPLGSGVTMNPGDGGTAPSVSSLERPWDDPFLYVGGNFQRAGDQPSAFLARFKANLPPTPQPDSYEMEPGTTLEIAAPGVLANDTDPDSPLITVGSWESAPVGEFLLWGDGHFTYTPPADYVGEVTVRYTAFDHYDESTMTPITITVGHPNHAPVTVADEYSVPQGGKLQVPAPGVLANDTDPDSETLTVEVYNPPGYGSLTLNPDGSFVYYAPTDYTGDVGATYWAYDGKEHSAVTSITFHVTEGEPTATPTESPKPTETEAPTPSPSPSESPSPTASEIPSPTVTLTLTPTPTPLPTWIFDLTDSDSDGYADNYEIDQGTNPNSSGSHPNLGDVNGDGYATTLDALLLNRWLLYGTWVSPDVCKWADVNLDGVCDVKDVLLIYRWAIRAPGFDILPHP